jgi:peptide/nickel transport system substrate-binding protein
MKRHTPWLLVMLALLALVAACVQPPVQVAPSAGEAQQGAEATATVGPVSEEGGPQRGGTLRVALEAEAVTYDPHLSVNVSERHVLYAVYNTLVAMDENLNIQPELAKAWTWSDDKQSITLELQEGVKFHDGTDFNADVVKWNIERILDPETGSGQRTNIAPIESVEVVDDNTVTFHLSTPYTPLLAYLAERPGFMVSPTAVEKWGDQFGLHPVGTGPFEFVEWVKDDHATLRRFEDYWEEGLPYLDEIIVQPIPDTTVKLANLRAGALDIIDEVPPKDIPTLRDSADFNVQVLPGTRWPMIRLNTASPPFDNKALRQAVSYGVNRDAIVDVVYFGLAQPAYGPISPLYTQYYQPDIKEYSYSFDVDQAKAKLEEAGVDSLTFDLLVIGTPIYTRLGELIQSSLKEANINAEIQVLEPGVWQERVNKKDFHAVIGSWTPRPDPDGVIYEHFHSNGRVNHVSYSNPEVDALLDESRRLPPGPERIETLQEAERLIVGDAPWTFLIFESTSAAMASNVHGLPPIPDTMFRLKTVWKSSD